MLKYVFSIRTRDGQPIKCLTIIGSDQGEAERKLKQMYHHCEVIDCRSHPQGAMKGEKKTFMSHMASSHDNKERISV